LKQRGLVRAEESQFWIVDRDGGVLVSDTGDDDGLVRFEPADTGCLVVRTGVEWGRVDVAAAVSDLAPEVQPGWDDVVEIWVRCEAGLDVKELFDDPKVGIVDQGGDYRLRVSARGRSDASGESRGGRTGAREEYLIEIWPAVESAPQVIVRSNFDVLEPGPVIEHLDAGLAAARRIAADISGSPGGRSLTGALGEIETEYRYRAGRRGIFTQFSFLAFLTGDIPGNAVPEPGLVGFSSGIGTYNAIVAGDWQRLELDDDPEIRYRFGDFKSPTFISIEWDWLVTGPSGSRNYFDLVPYLERPTELVFHFATAKDADGTPVTTVRVQHRGLPVEWLDDMREIWDWKLEDAAKTWGFNKSVS
jgi:hypothetical protein